MPPFEVERHASGVWSVHYDSVVNTEDRREANRIVDLVSKQFTQTYYDVCKSGTMACFQAADFVWLRLITELSLYTTNQWFGFQDRLGEQQGQNMVTIKRTYSKGPLVCLDPAFYLYDPNTTYEQLPIVVGNDLVGIASGMSEIYSQRLGRKILIRPYSFKTAGDADTMKGA